MVVNVFIFLLLLPLAVSADQDAFVGVNIGTALSDMPNPTQVAVLLKSQQIRHVRLYDADPAMLFALAGSGIQVTVTVPNQQILAVGQSNATAANWVSRNILPYVSTTNITAISVGSEVLTTIPNAATVLVSAMKYIHSALMSAGLDSKIKVSTAHSSSIILDSFPPSQAFFNRTVEPVMVQLLEFLRSTGSYLMLNVYPYYDYMQSNGVIPLDYALFRPLPPDKEAIDLNTLLHYTNVFDAVVDAAYFAMLYLNYTNIPVVVTESGWPSKGVAISTYIYELYNEDLKPGLVSEKNWGLFNADGRPIYVLHLMDSGSVLTNDTAGQTYCVAKNDADKKMLQAALDWACGPGKVNCSMMLQGEPCYLPDTVAAHATYAFDAYYHQMAMADGTCDFNGVATVTTTDPSRDGCTFPGSGGSGSNGTFNNGTASSLAPSSNSTTSGSPLLFGSVSFLKFSGILLWSSAFL
ncbi:glucan endo-1,3-beta-glucosidase 3-like isoform X2 [Cynara cardunculus var. scolymus]|uniref:glucan endo-1,3-beta-glucosidase 3-like isoform X2 n=1 Tax=Cynara cardunculus var. scolymus TaxID=59895 RepID=UPI000D62F7D2|nr:glucan endo-1,3-beta-glucosidase 3-like isoform X2 [Cynara cardunculus var. scolymus]